VRGKGEEREEQGGRKASLVLGLKEIKGFAQAVDVCSGSMPV